MYHFLLFIVQVTNSGRFHRCSTLTRWKPENGLRYNPPFYRLTAAGNPRAQPVVYETETLPFEKFQLFLVVFNTMLWYAKETAEDYHSIDSGTLNRRCRTYEIKNQACKFPTEQAVPFYTINRIWWGRFDWRIMYCTSQLYQLDLVPSSIISCIQRPIEGNFVEECYVMALWANDFSVPSEDVPQNLLGETRSPLYSLRLKILSYVAFKNVCRLLDKPFEHIRKLSAYRKLASFSKQCRSAAHD